jgi:hypothetical protein
LRWRGGTRSLRPDPSSSLRASGLSCGGLLGAGDGLRSFAALRMTGGGSGRRRLGLRLGLAGVLGLRGNAGLKAAATMGWEAVDVVAVDGGADGFAPGVGAEGVDVFVLGDVDGLQESLRHVGDGAGDLGFDVAADHGGDEAAQSGAEIAGGEIFAGEVAGQFCAETLRGTGASFLFGVVVAEMGMVAEARSAATAAIGERKHTQGHAVLWTESGHKVSLD